MGLSTSLGIAIGGLQATQVGIGVVSQNVSNAGTAGYVRRAVSNTETVNSDTIGVGNSNVQRLLDKIVQQQLWQESSGAAYTATRASVLSGVDTLYGAPGSATALDSVYSSFTSALQGLQSDPSSYSTRTAVLDSASQLATRLNVLSNGVQDLRTQAENGIETGVNRFNDLLGALTKINSSAVGGPNDSAKADLLDQRDRIVAELSQYVDIRTMEDARGSISITTTSGVQIFDGRPSVTFGFDEKAALNANSLWSANAAQRGVGTITMTDSNGNTSDAIANKVFRSGEIAAYVELRDKTLVQAQSQLDEIAAQLSSALSDREISGTPATVGTSTGFNVDMAALQAGNTVTLDYKATAASATQRVTFVKVEKASSLPLPASAGGDANNRVVGIDFSGTPVSVDNQIRAALGTDFNTSVTGDTLQIVAPGTTGAASVVGLTARPTNTTLSAGTAELPLFVDSGRANGAYTGSYEGGSQTTGFAARIAVNAGLVADRSKLVVYSASPATAQGDTTRPTLLIDRLNNSQRSFTRATSSDGAATSSTGTVSNFVQRVVSSQGQAVEVAQRLDEGQQVALAAVQSRFQDTAQVNVDQEMSTLIELQTAYAANARIISTVKEMMDTLMRI